MKKRPERPSPTSEAAERFIHGATADSDSTNSRHAATGFVRRTFDLEEPLAHRLKVEAAKQNRPMRELVTEALVEYLS